MEPSEQFPCPEQSSGRRDPPKLVGRLRCVVVQQNPRKGALAGLSRARSSAIWVDVVESAETTNTSPSAWFASTTASLTPRAGPSTTKPIGLGGESGRDFRHSWRGEQLRRVCQGPIPMTAGGGGSRQ
jgi:hypothetical protein